MSKVSPVPVGVALNISLDNYYDLLKDKLQGQGNDIKPNEKLQLNIAANIVDAEESDGKFWSLGVLIDKANTLIVNSPVNEEGLSGGTVLKGKFTEEYYNFVVALHSLLPEDKVPPAEQAIIDSLENENQALRKDLKLLQRECRKEWAEYATDMGYELTDDEAYLRWDQLMGYSQDVKKTVWKRTKNSAKMKGIELKHFPIEYHDVIQIFANLDDVNFEFTLPNAIDSSYDSHESWSLAWLMRHRSGDSALFTQYLATTFGLSSEAMKSSTGGAFETSFNRQQQATTSISTSWSGSSGASYSFFKVKGSASEQKKMTEEFSKTEKIELKASAVLKNDIRRMKWYNHSLFTHSLIKANPSMFRKYLGVEGSLRFVPTAIILVRGFSVTFENTQDWSYDYERKFSAKFGGGARVFGIKFGSSRSYSKHTKEHKVDQSSTKLTLSDGDSTLRVVGYTVSENTILDEVDDVDDVDINLKLYNELSTDFKLDEF